MFRDLMYEAIKNFAKQFAFDPQIQNAEKLPRADGFVVAGMGGSHLAADLLRAWKPELDLTVHSDYGFPADLKPEWLERMLFIASSYSGNTEETLDSFQEALKRNMPVAAIAAGGKLLEMAKERGIPFVQLPNTGIQPRSALGFSTKAILKLMREEEAFRKTTALAGMLDPLAYEQAGKELVSRLAGHVPVIYSSSRNRGIAYNWKIKFNETAKIPAFCNVFPELNHNEMNGFDITERTRQLSDKFYIIMITDSADDPRIAARMDIVAKMYRDRGLPVIEVPLRGDGIPMRIFSSLLLADWAAYYTARHYDLDPESVPMVEELKRLIAPHETT